MDLIKDIIPQVIDQISSKRVEDQFKIQKLWEALADKQIFDHSRINSFQNGELTIFVDSAALMYQLNLIKKRLLKNFQSEQPDIQNLVIKIGKIT